MSKKTGKRKEGDWTIERHRDILRFAGFPEECVIKCASCSGCAPNVVVQGCAVKSIRLKCGRTGHRPEYVTVKQALDCNGKRPILTYVLEEAPSGEEAALGPYVFDEGAKHSSCSL